MYQYRLSFGEAVARAFNNYCNFSGRASRSEYWWFQLFEYILGIAVGAVGAIWLSQTGANVLAYTVSLVLLLPGLGLFWRRMHDIGKSGLWILLNLIPLIGSIILIVWCCRPSDEGTNVYGDEPNMRHMA